MTSVRTEEGAVKYLPNFAQFNERFFEMGTKGLDRNLCGRPFWMVPKAGGVPSLGKEPDGERSEKRRGRTGERGERGRGSTCEVGRTWTEQWRRTW